MHKTAICYIYGTDNKTWRANKVVIENNNNNSNNNVELLLE